MSAQPRWRPCLGWFFRTVLAATLAPSGFCLDPNLSLTQYIHTTWTQNEGASLPGVLSLAQTRDGFLWMGTTRGLYSFDGLRFVPKTQQGLAGSPVTALAASGREGLWIAVQGMIARLDGESMVQYNLHSGVPGGLIPAIVENRDGKLWADSAKSGLISIDGPIVKQYERSRQFPVGQEQSLFRDRDDTLWIGAAEGFCRWDGNDVGPCYVTKPSTVISMARSPNGADLLIGTTRGILRLADGSQTPVRDRAFPEMPIVAMLRDADGNLWVGTIGQGIFCLRSGGRLEHFTRAQGLSSDSVRALLEDREGNIWVGTSNGLDRFRDPKVARWSTLEGLSGNVISAVRATRNGDVWIGVSNGDLNRLHGGKVSVYSAASGLKGSIVFALYEDPAGNLWAGTGRGLARFSSGRFIEFRSQKDSPVNQVLSITAGPNGDLWVADQQQGLLQLRDGRFAPYDVGWLEPGKVVSRIHADRESNLWIGYYQGGITLRGRDSTRSWSSQSGLAQGHVQVIHEDAEGAIWVGTSEGLSRYRNDRWTTWSREQGLNGAVQAVLEDGRGHFWLVTDNCLLLLQSAELSRTPDGAPGTLRYSTYGPSDGIRLAGAGIMNSSRATRSRDGRLWVGTEDGVASIDPNRIRVNSVPPPVHIEGLTVDGRHLPLASREVHFRGRQIQIDYTALSLTLPELVRFRYMLEGLDHDWILAGAHRQIVYANLPPAHYRFRVTACNNDGVWNPTGASLAFQSEPYFYQTWAFACSVALSLVLLGYMLHRVRLRQIRSRFQLVLNERARLTRELHDTILQGFAGVVYQLEAASRQMVSAPDASRRRIERALEQADQSLKEAREALSCIRLSALENKTLPEALSATARQIVDGTPIHFDMEVKGPVRQFPYEIEANLYIIAREALNNAMNHARPQRLSLELIYADDRIRMRVEDDGAGFDPDKNPKPGRLGLVGMRERARQIAALLTLESQPGHGTRLEVVVRRPGRAVR